MTPKPMATLEERAMECTKRGCDSAGCGCNSSGQWPAHENCPSVVIPEMQREIERLREELKTARHEGACQMLDSVRGSLIGWPNCGGDIEVARAVEKIIANSEAKNAELQAASREYIERTDPLISCGEDHTCGDCRGCLGQKVGELQAEVAKLLGIFSDYEEPCVDAAMATKIWNFVREREIATDSALSAALTVIRALGVVEQDGVLMAYRHGATGTSVAAFREIEGRL